MSNNTVIYEQPANELMRVCLRLEHLFQQIDSYLAGDQTLYSKELVRLILEIQSALDRPDLKSKFTQEFHRLIKVFSQLHTSPDISQPILNQTLADLQQLLSYFIDTSGKLAQALHENTFLTTIRGHLSTAGGDSAMDIPSLHYWLRQPVDKRMADIHHWLSNFTRIKDAVTLTLNIARHSADPVIVKAEDGYFHDVLTASPPCQLIRIKLDSSLQLYPKMSVGKHRMNIRFLEPHKAHRPTQTQATVPFELTLCYI